MGAHVDSSSSEKKLGNGLNDLPTFNAENLQQNMKTIHYSRTFMSIIGGVVAGIFGFTGLKGFVLYFLVMAFTSIGLMAKAKFSVHSYFDSWNRVLLDGLFGGLMVELLVISFYLSMIFLMISLIFLGSTIQAPLEETAEAIQGLKKMMCNDS